MSSSVGADLPIMSSVGADLPMHLCFIGDHVPLPIFG